MGVYAIKSEKANSYNQTTSKKYGQSRLYELGKLYEHS